MSYLIFKLSHSVCKSALFSCQTCEPLSKHLCVCVLLKFTTSSSVSLFCVWLTHENECWRDIAYFTPSMQIAIEGLWMEANRNPSQDVHFSVSLNLIHKTNLKCILWCWSHPFKYSHPSHVNPCPSHQTKLKCDILYFYLSSLLVKCVRWNSIYRH